MEQESTDPIIMTNKCLMACSSVVPDFNELVSATRRQKFSATGDRRRLLVSCYGGKVCVSCTGCESHTLKEVLMAEEGDLCFACIGIP